MLSRPVYVLCLVFVLAYATSVAEGLPVEITGAPVPVDSHLGDASSPGAPVKAIDKRHAVIGVAGVLPSYYSSYGGYYPAYYSHYPTYYSPYYANYYYGAAYPYHGGWWI